jgi:TonB family protein
MTSERTAGWLDGIAHCLIHRAARRAPDSLSERLEEEWLADFAEQSGLIQRLRFAIGCCWATNVIAREHPAAGVPATSPATGPANFIRSPTDDFPFFTGRTITFVLVASLHVAVLYGLAMGLGPSFTKVIAGPFELHPIEPTPRTSLPPPPRPQLSAPRIELPPQESMPLIEPDPAQTIEATPREPPQSVSPPSVPPVVNRVQGGPGNGFPSANDFYPDMSIRMGETGIATVKACVNAQGRLMSEPSIIESTGSTRLDEAALRLAKTGSGHYRASTEEGRPVNACYPFRIRFQLRN